ncbi:hypothetical protein [Nocardia sp. NPDC005366]|uniref:hypothetical protein n=1 Tax=Nocardia sp. NPDC005366 TaxID=3156878 RepID=UPI0033B4B1C8
MTENAYSDAEVEAGPVVWPDPSPLSEWWETVMGLSTRAVNGGRRRDNHRLAG